MMFRLPRFPDYRARIERLSGHIGKHDIQRRAFLLERDGRLAVYYAPFHSQVNESARVMIVGLTPGWTQAKIAYERCSEVLNRGGTQAEALAAVSADAPFAGMRSRLCRWLDELSVAAWLNIDSTQALFDCDRTLLYTTSLIRYPVFTGEEGDDYHGAGRRPITSPLLNSIIKAVFKRQLAAFQGALVVPLGVAVSTALYELGVPESQCLYGFPHPSRINSHAEQQFREARGRMRKVVSRLP
jgi:hypothetical protein